MKIDNGKPSIESLKDKPIHTQTQKNTQKRKIYTEQTKPKLSPQIKI